MNKQYNLVQSINRLANSAVHCSPITREDANAVIDTARVLRDQYLAWLSWGFQDKKLTLNPEVMYVPTALGADGHVW